MRLAQATLFEEVDAPGAGPGASAVSLPDVMAVMDLQQEQLARSLGAGHRVIHGVAGSGKTMILGYRAEYLAKATPARNPVLVLCFNEPLAVQLAEGFARHGVADRVHARRFHLPLLPIEMCIGDRSRGIPCDVAPSAAKFGKQIRYADRRGIPFVWFPGAGGDGGDEVKDIRSGEQTPADPMSWAPPTDDLHARVVRSG